MSLQAQNIYEDQNFFAAYRQLPRSQNGLAGAPEWPTLRNMIYSEIKGPDHATQRCGLNDLRVLDLGCGYGWFARWARDEGAAYVKGIDISDKMISHARTFESQTPLSSDRAEYDGSACMEIQYEVGDIQTIHLADAPEVAPYDLVYSSLTFHYVEDIGKVYQEIHRSLKPGGTLVFSVEHPVFSAPIRPSPDWLTTVDDGQEVNVWPLNSYSEEGWRISNWLGVNGVRKYHRTVETYICELINNGFMLKGLKEWVPSKEDVATHPEWADERNRPYFLLISASAR
ncbi:hypothetical protein N7478_012168 [Penicillium angulare]|uniref:uncharacterized protein n=1 Tax=Penicillium angulare TaxID=116970 RepID=UPI00253FBDE0|nr:uncharacterized protein N7478_012168 [Penicillium angulare]KAJ5260563.1 hypothetical protein N7478_012168 [Penicillium angulare]